MSKTYKPINACSLIMASIRPGGCYRKPKRPYTRVSKFKGKSYVKGVPGSKIQQFETGDRKGEFDLTIHIVSRQEIQLRHNCLEAFRVSTNQQLIKRLGMKNYHLKVKVYPHQVMRHNPTANFAGADRFSDGMKHCFGKPLGRAAVVSKEQKIFFVRANEDDLKDVKKAIKIGLQKLPGDYRLLIE